MNGWSGRKEVNEVECGADHGKKDAELRIHLHGVSVGEDECFSALFLAGEDYGDLLGGHRQHREIDPVKLVKAAPGARLSKAFGTKHMG